MCNLKKYVYVLSFNEEKKYYILKNTFFNLFFTFNPALLLFLK